MVERRWLLHTIRRVPFGPEDRRPAAEQQPGCQAARSLLGVRTNLIFPLETFCPFDPTFPYFLRDHSPKQPGN